jgi:phospholipid/cholesterol/gamma-HCH transport system permease protein
MGPLAPALAWLQAWARALRFTGIAFAAALSPSTYRAQTRDVALKQIYFTAWQILPGFVLFAGLFSLIVIDIAVTAAREYGLAQYALELVLRSLVLELIPLVTALFVALRSGAAIASEVALMQASGEIGEMEADGEDPMALEFVPRIAAAALSVLSLTVVSCGVALVLAYVSVYGFSPWGADEYARTVAAVFSLSALAGFALKCVLFGIAVAVIPIAAGLHATSRLKSVPVAVLGGMVRLFFALGLIEVGALAVKYV